MKDSDFTDIELVDEYIEKCAQFVNPRLLAMVTSRGLYNVINFLPGNRKEAKAVARARLAKIGKYFEDEEITQIANEIQRIEFLRCELMKLKATDVHKTLEIIEEMKTRSEFVKDYFKENQSVF